MADEEPPAKSSAGEVGRERGQSKRKQGQKEQKPSRGAKKRRGEEHEEEESKQQQQADEYEGEQYHEREDEYDPRFDDDPIDVHVAKGDGETYDHTFALEAAVGDVKQQLERKEVGVGAVEGAAPKAVPLATTMRRGRRT